MLGADEGFQRVPPRFLGNVSFSTNRRFAGGGRGCFKTQIRILLISSIPITVDSPAMHLSCWRYCSCFLNGFFGHWRIAPLRASFQLMLGTVQLYHTRKTWKYYFILNSLLLKWNILKLGEDYSLAIMKIELRGRFMVHILNAMVWMFQKNVTISVGKMRIEIT